MCEKVTARCTWPQLSGNGLDKLVATRLSDEDVFVKPDLDDVIDEDRAVLFSMQSADPPPPCELRFQIPNRFKIAALTLICSAPKVELFIGPLQEYCETIYGTCVDEEDPEVAVRPYRYDMEIDRSGINDLNLKMLTSASEICVYGALLQVAPNPNGITTQMPRPMDAQRIQELLQRGGTSPLKKEEQSEKFEQFMSLMKGYSPRAKEQAQEAASPSNDVAILKEHIDMRFEKLTQLVSKRLDNFEAQQTEKLNKIIALLEKEK